MKNYPTTFTSTNIFFTCALGVCICAYILDVVLEVVLVLHPRPRNQVPAESFELGPIALCRLEHGPAQLLGRELKVVPVGRQGICFDGERMEALDYYITCYSRC